MSKEFPRIFHVEHIIDTCRLLELGTMLLVAAARSDFGCCVKKKAGGNTATMQMTTVDNGEISDVNSHRIWRPWQKSFCFLPLLGLTFGSLTMFTRYFSASVTYPWVLLVGKVGYVFYFGERWWVIVVVTTVWNIMNQQGLVRMIIKKRVLKPHVWMPMKKKTIITI